MKRIFATITTSKSHKYTFCCLRSFFDKTSLEPDDRVILIDNDATYVADIDYPRLEIQRNAAPLGFSENGNVLIDIALQQEADLFFFNNDVVFTSGWIDPLLVEKTSILSPLSNREVHYGASAVVVVNQKVADAFVTDTKMELEDYLGHEHSLDYVNQCHKKTTEGYWKVYVVPFFCVKLPFEVLAEVGRFDESFGKGGAEDFDYCFRAILKGYDVKFALNSYLLHFGGKSSWSGVETKEEQEEREKIFRSEFARKWGEPLTALTLFEDISAIESDPVLQEAEKRKDLKYVIESLRVKAD